MIPTLNEELLRRLKLIRNIRQSYIQKYNLTKNEISFSYSLLENLDDTQYIKIDGRKVVYGKYVNEKTVDTYDQYSNMKHNRGEVQAYWGGSYTVKGQFEKELGYIFVKDKVLEDGCTDKDIRQIEELEIKECLGFLKYRLNSDIKIQEEKIKNIENEIHKKKQRLEWLNNQ